MSPISTENGSFSSDKDKGVVDITFFLYSIIILLVLIFVSISLALFFEYPNLSIKLQAARGAGQ